MYTCIKKIYVMKFLKYIKMCMLLNRTRIFEIVQEPDIAIFFGLKFGRDDNSLTEDKAKALREAGPPTTFINFM